jgi:hypothetical protein
MIVHTGRTKLQESGQHRNVVGLAYGRRSTGGAWANENGLVVFVTKKPRADEALDDRPLPRYIDVPVGRSKQRVPIDVVSVGGARGEFALSLDDSISLTPGAPSAGCFTWFQDGFVITAEHITGFGSVQSTVYAGPAAIGAVTHTAYETTKLDACRIDPNPGTTLYQQIGGAGPSVSACRYVTGDDVFTNSNWATAYLPSAGGNAVQIAIRHVHATGVFPFKLGAVTYYPTTLILCDPVSQGGDSGCLLLGSDGLAIGILTGLVDAPSAQSYTAFTELAPALDTLVPHW